MSVSGLCQVCESAEAQFQCRSCGALVCAKHYDRDTGLCTKCASSGGGRVM
jgi:B-box zinc finger.